jgi:hypothetical protein
VGDFSLAELSVVVLFLLGGGELYIGFCFCTGGVVGMDVWVVLYSWLLQSLVIYLTAENAI